MLRISLLGYGKMGKAVEQEALARGHEIAFRIDAGNLGDMALISPENTDVAIEFTHPEAFGQNLHAMLKAGVVMVSGTTGWYKQLPEVKAQVEAEQGGLLYSSNFSIGVNLLFRLNTTLARWMNSYPQYDVFIEEQHHRHKADAPSGTAFSLAKQILGELDRKTSVADNLSQRAPLPEELSVGYTRAGEIVGRHTVTWTSDIDSLSIEHHALNRRGFALGAVVAAEWMAGRKGCVEFIDIF
ncbi:MAG: 4-hydroxy-tetrahydrodipicolinate reductase [Bacteroidetes bacterium]|nr:MAG: 4-hydroxy-tetrahydrodipicolinate reductase [Bacteroidota bacterium]